MTILSLSRFFGPDEDEMAKAAAINEPLVPDYLDRRVRAKTDRRVFDTILAALKSDGQLKAADVIAIAQRYNRGGKRSPSKAKALAAISKRFVEIVRFHAKNEVAAKARPW